LLVWNNNLRGGGVGGKQPVVVPVRVIGVVPVRAIFARSVSHFRLETLEWKANTHPVVVAVVWEEKQPGVVAVRAIFVRSVSHFHLETLEWKASTHPVVVAVVWEEKQPGVVAVRAIFARSVSHFRLATLEWKANTHPVVAAAWVERINLGVRVGGSTIRGVKIVEGWKLGSTFMSGE